jgi:hypothetical protein
VQRHRTNKPPSGLETKVLKTGEATTLVRVSFYP